MSTLGSLFFNANVKSVPDSTRFLSIRFSHQVKKDKTRFVLFKKCTFYFCTKSYQQFTLWNTKYNHISVKYIQNISTNSYMAKMFLRNTEDCISECWHCRRVTATQQLKYFSFCTCSPFKNGFGYSFGLELIGSSPSRAWNIWPKHDCFNPLQAVNKCTSQYRLENTDLMKAAWHVEWSKRPLSHMTC